jgi:hypothetical protein
VDGHPERPPPDCLATGRCIRGAGLGANSCAVGPDRVRAGLDFSLSCGRGPRVETSGPAQRRAGREALSPPGPERSADRGFTRQARRCALRNRAANFCVRRACMCADSSADGVHLAGRGDCGRRGPVPAPTQRRHFFRPSQPPSRARDHSGCGAPSRNPNTRLRSSRAAPSPAPSCALRPAPAGAGLVQQASAAGTGRTVKEAVATGRKPIPFRALLLRSSFSCRPPPA